MNDGEYTVIMMNKSGRYGAAGTLEDFSKYDLEENKDYIKKSFNIEKGKTTKLENIIIPDMDTDKASIFDRKNTSVKVNRSTFSAGQYAVVSVDYTLKDDIEMQDMKLELSFPSKNLKPQWNSITIDGEGYNLEYRGGDSVSVPVTKKSGTVIIALQAVESSDKCIVGAAISYKNEIEEVSETIDSVSVSVEDFYFWLPEYVSETTVHSFGSTQPNKKIEYYDNGVLAGTAYSNASGDYTIDFDLIDPRDRSYHEIYVIAEMGDSSYKTSPRELEYDKEAIVVEKVNMYWTSHVDHCMTIDFMTSGLKDLFFVFNPANPRFTFEVFFQGDVSKVTYAAVLTTANNGDITRVTLSYDEKRGAFIGSTHYDIDTRPTGISVDFRAEQKDLVDYGAAYAKADELYGLMEEYNSAAEEMEKAALEVEEASTITKDEMVSYLKEYGFTDETIAMLDLDELLETSNNNLTDYIDQIGKAGDEALGEEIIELDQYFEELNALYESLDEISGIYAIDESVTAEQLIKEGYKQISTYNDNGLIFERGNDKNEYDFIDLTRRYAMVYPKDTDIGKIPNTSGTALDIYPSGACVDCDHNIIPPSNIANVTMKIAKTVKPAAKLMYALMRGIQGFQKTQFGFLNSVLDTYKVVVPEGLGDPANIKNPQLKFLAEKVIGNIAANKYVQKTLKFNAALQSVLAPLQALCEAIIALSDLGDICSMIERLAPQLCSCTEYSNYVVQDAINDLYFQLAAIAVDVTSCSIPEFNSMYDLAKTGWKGLFKGLGKLKLIDEKTVRSFTDPFAYGRQSTKNRLLLTSRFLSDCKCDNDKDKNDNIIKMRSGVDPSGFICEAVPSNRISGVTATLWYSESEDGSNAVVWDAEPWSQENPLISDTNGHYEWYVPEGWWQVRFEKEGYEKAYSEWVPVLPIQTEVNISMKSLYAPEVKNAVAYSDSVDISFSQYMDIYSVNSDTVKIYDGDTQINGKVEPLNAEASFDNPRVQYASKFRFIPEKTISGEVNISIDKVKSYNGLYINSEFKKKAVIVEKLKKIIVPQIIVLKYDESTDIDIQLQPESAASNVEVKISAVGSDMIEISSDTVTTDENGKAKISVKGRLPAQVELTFIAEDFDVSAVTKIVLSEDPDKEEPVYLGVFGDVDDDGKISAKDSLYIQRYVINLKKFDDTQLRTADVNDDGKVTNKDALDILRYTINLSKNDRIGKSIS